MVAGLIILALPVTRLSGMIGNISAIVILLMSVGLSVAVALRKGKNYLACLIMEETMNETFLAQSRSMQQRTVRPIKCWIKFHH